MSGNATFVYKIQKLLCDNYLRRILYSQIIFCTIDLKLTHLNKNCTFMISEK